MNSELWSDERRVESGTGERQAERAQTPAGSTMALKSFVYKYGLIVVLIGMVVFFSIEKEAFRTYDNWIAILQSCAVVTVIALGATISMVVGGFDLSVGATAGMSVMVASLLMVRFDQNGIVAIILAIFVGVIIGLFNSFLIVRAGIPDLVATLATLFLVNGLSLWIASGQSVVEGMTLGDKPAPGKFSSVFLWFGNGKVANVPAPVIVMIVVFVAAFLFLNQTRWGRAMYAIGGNPVAASMVGIRVKRYRTVAYVLAGIAAAIGGILLAARLGRGDVSVGDPYLLQAVSASLVGYAVLGANKANAVGTLVGALFVAILINGLTMFNFPYYTQSFVQGALLVVALVISYTLSPGGRR